MIHGSVEELLLTMDQGFARRCGVESLRALASVCLRDSAIVRVTSECSGLVIPVC